LFPGIEKHDDKVVAVAFGVVDRDRDRALGRGDPGKNDNPISSSESSEDSLLTFSHFSEGALRIDWGCTVEDAVDVEDVGPDDFGVRPLVGDDDEIGVRIVC